MIGFEKMADHPDAEPLYAPAKSRCVIGDLAIHAGRVFRVMARHGLQK